MDPNLILTWKGGCSVAALGVGAGYTQEAEVWRWCLWQTHTPLSWACSHWWWSVRCSAEAVAGVVTASLVVPTTAERANRENANNQKQTIDFPKRWKRLYGFIPILNMEWTQQNNALSLERGKGYKQGEDCGWGGGCLADTYPIELGVTLVIQLWW